MTALRITVHGTPAAQGSKRHVGNGVMIEDSKRTKPWRDSVKSATEAAIAEWESEAEREWKPLDGPIRVTVAFRFPRPKKHYRTGRFADVLRDDAPAYHSGSPDIDKCVRAVFDALTQAGAWRDDSRVAMVFATKVYADRPGCSIHIETTEVEP